MGYDNKPGTGALFKNKSENEKAPQYKGDFTTPDGKKYSISLWSKDGKSGQFYSAKVEDYKERAEKPVEVPSAKQNIDDSDYPF